MVSDIISAKCDVYKYNDESIELIASKNNSCLQNLININNHNGSMWFEAIFNLNINDKIYLKDCTKITVSVGGNNDASKSRHWFQIQSDNKNIQFVNKLPILVLSAATST